ncbi:MAG TPA: ATP-binding cassette domain-containing protein [Pseudomonadota bacterium]|jgi:oligopeptide/dipeptide ABC transporter ATP-binding protein|nr:ATP-binding cassette domain-containing protein [Pseudomonadota bacterium]
MTPLLHVEKLCKHYALSKRLLHKTQFVRAVEEVSFSIQPGKSLGLVGESGCGKSTLGRSVLRLVEPTSGTVAIDGTQITQLNKKAMAAFRRHAQMIFQDPFGSLNPRMTVRQTLSEPLHIHGLFESEGERKQRLADLLSQVGLPEQSLNLFPHEFSGGQRQRIVIARALAVEPKLIVADEPVSALDVSIQAQIVNLLKSVQEQSGLTYLFISHDLKVVRHLCDEVAVMYLGRLVEQATTQQLFEEPLHPYTQALIAAIPRPPGSLPLPHSRPGDSSIGFRPRTLLLGGEPPSLLAPPSGCAFHPRCRLYEDAGRPAICRTDRPDLVTLSSGKSDAAPIRVACHLQKDSQTK